MKRIFKIILILIAAFALILTMIWLIGRNQAIKNGKQPLTFREFLGLGTKKNNAQTVPGETSSDFGSGTKGSGANGETGGTNGTGTGTAGNPNFNDGSDNNISLFTNGSFNPSTGTIGGTDGTDTGNTDTGTIGSGGSTDTGNGSDTSSPGDSNTGSQPTCSDEDTNISFTTEELAQLNILQTRFYALAQSLHNDNDVATEVANHDAFTLKANQDLELYAYCETKLPALNQMGDNHLKLHVATPFWRSYYNDATIPAYVNARIGKTIPANDPAQDSLSLLTLTGLDVGHIQGVHDNNPDNPEGTTDILPGVSVIRGPYGLLTFSKPGAVPITGSAVGTYNGTDINSNNAKTGDTGILMPVVEKMLHINLW